MSADFRSVRTILWEDWDPIGAAFPKMNTTITSARFCGY